MEDTEDVQEVSQSGFNPVPSMFTLCNALCGLTAIIMVLNAKGGSPAVPPMALWLVFGAMLFDVFDGLAARILNARSMHGLHLDSLADAISFGVAPAVFIYSAGMNGVDLFGMADKVSWLVAGLYLGCALWRLAAYNTRALAGIDKSDKAVFVGLPSPAAAAMVCCMVHYLPEFLPHPMAQFIGSMAYAAAAALLMVGSAPYPHLRNLFERFPPWVPVLALILVVASIVNLGVAALVLWAHIYILSAPIHMLVVRVLNWYEEFERVHLSGER